MRIPRAIEVGAAAVLWTALIVGLSVLTLTVPVYTSALSGALDVSASAGLPATQVAVLSEKVRAFVADPAPATLPPVWEGRSAFGASEVSHLADVRTVLAGARAATGASALALAVYVAWCVAKRRFAPLRSGMAWGSGATVVFIVLAGVAALFDFDSFFTAFHGLFFANGTWTFPYDSLIIRLFPEPFWAASGGAWALLSLAAAGVLGLASWLLRGTASDIGASRMANNV